MNPEANTKRLILRSIAENFDPYNFDIPLMNRAKLFLHELQCDKSVNWDRKLPEDRLKTWRNISKQLNSAEPICVPRFVGLREGNFKLIAFVDSSSEMYGVVVYVFDIHRKIVSFILAKNRMIGKKFAG